MDFSNTTEFSNRKKYIRCVLTIGMAVLMVLVAGIFKDKEIIFPEIAALVIGAWFMERQPWKVNKVKFVILMTLSAIVGIVIVRYISIPLFFKVTIALVFTSFSLIVAKATLVPMISACILPIYLGTTSVIYPISVGIMSLIIVFIQKILQDNDYIEQVEYIPAWDSFKEGSLYFIPRMIVFLLLACFPIMMGKVYFVAPPLIVTFMEFSNSKAKIRNHYMKACILIALAACIGTFARLVMYGMAGISLTICTALIIGILLLLFTKLGIAFPPVGAIAMLPLILKVNGLIWYPVFVTVGCVILVKVAMVCFKEKVA